MSSVKALIIVDVQNDFCPGGAYPVPNGDEVVRPLNSVLKFGRKHSWKIYASRDWHPRSAFKDNIHKAHCIQETEGAKYHPLLDIKDDIDIVSKGRDSNDTNYSAFNGDDKSLNQIMRRNKVKEVYIGGLALEFCVRATALDSARLGFKTYIFEDAVRHISEEKAKKAIEEMKRAEIIFIRTSDLGKVENYLPTNINNLQ